MLSPEARKAQSASQFRTRLYEIEQERLERERAALVEAVQPAALHEPKHIRAFVLGGVATFTIRSSRTGVRYTYQVTKAKDRPNDDRERPYFVSVLRGPDNEQNYKYMGLLWEDSDNRHKYVHPKKSQVDYAAPEAAAFRVFWMRINAEKSLVYKDGSILEFFHAGFCARCGKLLTVPASITAGFGPVCITKVNW